MSKGYLLQVFNKTQSSFKLNVTLDNHWESVSANNPRRSLDDVTLGPLGRTGKAHCEVASDAATFTITFTSSTEGSLSVRGAAGKTAYGGLSKGEVPVVA